MCPTLELGAKRFEQTTFNIGQHRRAKAPAR
jgi:hypothetical protein